MSPGFEQMRELAKNYCSLIEGVQEYDNGWLRELEQLLPRLHAAVATLGSPNYSRPAPLSADLDARFELFMQLRQVLGGRDSYWMEFDVAQDGQSMSGSLADDLTDIYCELKRGLARLENEPDKAIDDWCSGYRYHWGQHLMDAEKHLYELRLRGQV